MFVIDIISYIAAVASIGYSLVGIYVKIEQHSFLSGFNVYKFYVIRHYKIIIIIIIISITIT